APAQTCGAPTHVCGAPARTCGASSRVCRAPARTFDVSAHICEACAQEPNTPLLPPPSNDQSSSRRHHQCGTRRLGHSDEHHVVADVVRISAKELSLIADAEKVALAVER